MAIAKGIAKSTRYKKESSYGVLAGASGAQVLRRLQSTLSLNKDTYQSNELRQDYQVADFRHGVRRVQGDINGEFSLATYQDFLAAILRKSWTATANITEATGAMSSATLSVGANSITASAGSWITAGLRVGQVIRPTAGFVAGNMSRNLRITALTATVITVAETLTVEAGPLSTYTIAVPGKELWVPSTGHTDDSFTIEHYFSDVDETETFTGCKVNTAEIALPPTGLSTVRFGVIGKDMTEDPNGDGSAPYFTAPTDETTTAILAAVNGTLRIGGSEIATVTGLTLNLTGNLSGDPTIGSNTIPEQFPGRVVGTGQFTAYYEGGSSLLSDFKNETEISLHAMLTAAGAAPQDFMAIHLPRIKLGGNSKDDGEKGLIQTIPFQMLKYATDGATRATTISIQDSAIA